MSRSVLLIDEEEHFLTAMAARLRANGYNVLTAPNGEKGVRTAADHRPCAVICEVSMPGIDGFETVRHLREIPGCETIPVVFLTASIQPKNRAMAQEVGATCFLSKPCESRKLLSALQQATTG